MRYELTDCEWAAIKPFLPNKPRGVPRVNDRRVLNGIFWVLRSGAPWRDLPENFGPYTTCYNRFARWRRAGVWDQLMNALTASHDAAVQIIDTSIVRVHQHGACIAGNCEQLMGRSRGGRQDQVQRVPDQEVDRLSALTHDPWVPGCRRPCRPRFFDVQVSQPHRRLSAGGDSAAAGCRADCGHACHTLSAGAIGIYRLLCEIR
jgi:transposase